MAKQYKNMRVYKETADEIGRLAKAEGTTVIRLMEELVAGRTEWAQKDVEDLMADFVGIDMRNPQSSIRKVVDAAFDEFLLQGVPRQEAQAMAEGIWAVLERIAWNAATGHAAEERN